jgi:hypothetical protein
MKLHEGDKIEIAEDTLADTKEGVYWVAYVSYCHGNPYYGLRRFYGRKVIARFFTNTVDVFLGSRIRRMAA